MRHNSARTQCVSGEMRGAALEPCPFPLALPPHPTPLANPAPKHSSLGSPRPSGFAICSRPAAHFRLQSCKQWSASATAWKRWPRILNPFLSCARGICSQERSSEEVWSTHRFSEAAVWFRLFILALVQSHRPSARKGSKSSCRHASGLFAI